MSKNIWTEEIQIKVESNLRDIKERIRKTEEALIDCKDPCRELDYKNKLSYLKNRETFFTNQLNSKSYVSESNKDYNVRCKGNNFKDFRYDRKLGALVIGTKYTNIVCRKDWLDLEESFLSKGNFFINGRNFYYNLSKITKTLNLNTELASERILLEMLVSRIFFKLNLRKVEGSTSIQLHPRFDFTSLLDFGSYSPDMLISTRWRKRGSNEDFIKLKELKYSQIDKIPLVISIKSRLVTIFKKDPESMESLHIYLRHLISFFLNETFYKEFVSQKEKPTYVPILLFFLCNSLIMIEEFLNYKFIKEILKEASYKEFKPKYLVKNVITLSFLLNLDYSVRNFIHCCSTYNGLAAFNGYNFLKKGRKPHYCWKSGIISRFTLTVFNANCPKSRTFDNNIVTNLYPTGVGKNYGVYKPFYIPKFILSKATSSKEKNIYKDMIDDYIDSFIEEDATHPKKEFQFTKEDITKKTFTEEDQEAVYEKVRKKFEGDEDYIDTLIGQLREAFNKLDVVSEKTYSEIYNDKHVELLLGGYHVSRERVAFKDLIKKIEEVHEQERELYLNLRKASFKDFYFGAFYHLIKNINQHSIEFKEELAYSCNTFFYRFRNVKRSFIFTSFYPYVFSDRKPYARFSTRYTKLGYFFDSKQFLNVPFLDKSLIFKNKK